jgi:hypothetical protein
VNKQVEIGEGAEGRVPVKLIGECWPPQRDHGDALALEGGQGPGELLAAKQVLAPPVHPGTAEAIANTGRDAEWRQHGVEECAQTLALCPPDNPLPIKGLGSQRCEVGTGFS